jgi:pimeloyl-ACP methyl ester carboxylesterase
MTRVRKGFVDLPHGQVHFRYGGRGPVVVLLHDSPRSSALHVTNIEWLGEHFTVIAPDVPGSGSSTPLPQVSPAIPDFSDALADTLTALGIERCAIYGLHSGGKIALRFAADHPPRASLTVLDGLALATEPPARKYLERYLPPFEPTADGAYLARQWRRILDFHRYFPWFEPNADTRLRRALPDDAELHDYATDLFMAGRHWADAYGAALRHVAIPDIQRLRSHTVLMCRDDDVLQPGLDHLPQLLPAQFSIERIPSQLAAWRTRLLEVLKRADLPHTGWKPPHAGPAVGGPGSRRRYVDLVHGQLHLRLRGDRGGSVPLLLLHDAPGGSCALQALAQDLANDRLTIAPDLPGLGESHPLPYPSLGSYVAALAETLERLETGPVDVFAEGLGACFAVALAAHHSSLVRRLALDGLPVLRVREQRLYAKHYCPPLIPDRHGSHLLQAWGQLCDVESSWPWFERSPAAARRREPDLDPEGLHARLVEVMKQLPSYGDAARAALESRVRDILRGVNQPVLLFDVPEDVRYEGTQTAARRLAAHRIVPRPGTPAARAAHLREFLA